MSHNHEKREERREHEILERIWEGIQLETHLLREIIRLLHPHPPTLSSIKLILSGGITMPVGPLTIAAGKPFTASVVGFDQNGAAWTGPLPTTSFAVDNSAIATVDGASGAGQAVAAGVANVTGSLTSAEGLALSDTETVTVTAIVPVLSSIKVSLDAA